MCKCVRKQKLLPIEDQLEMVKRHFKCIYSESLFYFIKNLMYTTLFTQLWSNIESEILIPGIS